MKSAYIHIPFCEHICHYCDFNKYFIQSQPVDEYLNALEQEMINTIAKTGQPDLKTIFIGGGTPTSLSEEQLKKLMDMINRVLKPSSNLSEFAVEANPDDLSAEKLKILKEAGVNRLSFGVQTFEDDLLEKIGRVHALSLDAEHYSVYSLIVEPKTVFYNLMQKGRLHLPPQEQEAEMYEMVMSQMEAHGIHQYEISNFAKAGMESKHNLTYWSNEQYFGFGAGAHGYIGGTRTVNVGPVKHYIDLIAEKGFPYRDTHEVTTEEQIEEEMFLGLRKTAGVSKKRFAEKYGRSLDELFPSVLKDLAEKGLIHNSESAVYLTHQGKLLGNEVFGAFLGEL
ncbi:radical SAM family heme chaperone HemW [Bacillus subtilis]|uniref:radical SAM family heme chaperone HemW n=1 Tax=Bacillus subtilis TaxID=1423 RepID=UPI0039A46F59